VKVYLNSSSKTEDTVVGLLLGKTLQSKENLLGLFGDQIIGPTTHKQISTALSPSRPCGRDQLTLSQWSQMALSSVFVPQTKLPVSSGIPVPIGDRGEHTLEPWALHNIGSKRGLRHIVVVELSRNGNGSGVVLSLLVVVIQSFTLAIFR
jgi:hypothetical protein